MVGARRQKSQRISPADASRQHPIHCARASLRSADYSQAFCFVEGGKRGRGNERRSTRGSAGTKRGAGSAGSGHGTRLTLWSRTIASFILHFKHCMRIITVLFVNKAANSLSSKGILKAETPCVRAFPRVAMLCASIAEVGLRLRQYRDANIHTPREYVRKQSLLCWPYIADDESGVTKG